MKRIEPLRLTVVALLSVGAGLALYLWATIVPYRTYDTREFLEQKGFEEVPSDAEIRRMIFRAQLDYMISPTPTGRDKLLFVRAKQDSNVLYLFFKPLRWSNTAVVYAYDARSRKTLWKTEVGTQF